MSEDELIAEYKHIKSYFDITFNEYLLLREGWLDKIGGAAKKAYDWAQDTDLRTGKKLDSTKRKERAISALKTGTKIGGIGAAAAAGAVPLATKLGMMGAGKIAGTALNKVKALNQDNDELSANNGADELITAAKKAQSYTSEFDAIADNPKAVAELSKVTGLSNDMVIKMLGDEASAKHLFKIIQSKPIDHLSGQDTDDGMSLGTMGLAAAGLGTAGMLIYKNRARILDFLKKGGKLEKVSALVKLPVDKIKSILKGNVKSENIENHLIFLMRSMVASNIIREDMMEKGLISYIYLNGRS